MNNEYNQMSLDETQQVKPRKFKLLTFYKRDWPKPYVVLAFRVPAFVGFKVSWATVKSRPPVIGTYLQPYLYGKPIPYIEFLPKGKIPGVSKGPTTMYRLRQDVDLWDRDYQQVALLNRGEVFGLMDIYLNEDCLVVNSVENYPIALRGAYEPL